MADIITLEPQLKNFYAPTFQVVVNNKDLVAELWLEVVSVQVDHTLDGADQFTIVINNAFDIEKREFVAGGKDADLIKLFEFGSPVEIRFGYESELEQMVTGIVTSIRTSFPSNGRPQISVSGYDHSYCMTLGKKSKNWDKKKDSDVVQEIARKYDLKASSEDTRVKHPKIEQSQESDYQFLKKLAERNGYEMYVVDKELRFRPPASLDSPKVTLENGGWIGNVSPEINIHKQISEVEVVGWDVKTKKEIVGKALAGRDEPGRDKKRKSGGEYVASLCKEPVKLRIRQPVYSKQEADQRAKALLKRHSEGFITGSGDSIGLPFLRPDQNVEFTGLGSLFSKIYYIQQTTHTVSGSGYQTTFRFKETTI